MIWKNLINGGKKLINLKSTFVAAVLGLTTLSADAGMLNNTPSNNNNCQPMYHAKTFDNNADVFMCATENNILFAYGKGSSKYPDILLSVPKAEVQIRSYVRGLTRLGYDVLIPSGDSWQVISFRPDGTYIKTFNGNVSLASVRKEIDSINGITINKLNETNSIWSIKGPLEIQEEL